MSTMTQVAKGLRNNAADLDRMDMLPMLAGYLRNAADAIDAHLAQPGQAADVGAIREVINYLQDEGNACIATGDGLDAQWGSRILSMGRKLARALSGEKAGSVGDAYCGLRIVENADVPDGELWVYSRKVIPTSPAPDKEG